jgi:hypothetical protein
VVLAITYHPKLQSVSSQIKKNTGERCKDPKAKEIFPLPPMVAFKQPTNLRNKVCHAKLPDRKKTKKDR